MATPAESAPAAAAKAADDAIPQPPPPRQIKREHDGASTATPRKNGELAKLITPNDEFYITTKNPVSDPVVDGATWRLVLDGEVNRPVQLDYRTLRRLPAIEFASTLECISNFVDKPELAPFGNNLISNATWKGVRLKDVLALAGGLKPGAKLHHPDHGRRVQRRRSRPRRPTTRTCILAYEMNGQVLPREHGYPTRLLMPGRYGLKSAKWVIAIRPQQRETLDWYGQRGWSKDGVAKTMSRIDVPGAGAMLPAGRQRIAGIAYGAQPRHREGRVLGRRRRDLAAGRHRPEARDRRRGLGLLGGQVRDAGQGGLTLRCRAVDGDGQPPDRDVLAAAAERRQRLAHRRGQERLSAARTDAAPGRVQCRPCRRGPTTTCTPASPATGATTMEEMCRAALEHGLDEIAITDHFDGHPLDECHDFYRPDAYFAELARCRELFAGRLTIRAGIEVGDPHRFGEQLAPTLAAWPYDFAIGSVHWIDDVSPFGRAFFQSHAADVAWSGYFREARRLAEADLFDVVGHIDMIKREGTEFYGPFDCQPYAEIVRETLERLIARGKGIEINTSGFRKSANEPCPGPADPALVRRARRRDPDDRVGRPRTEHIALRRADAVAMAREAGLRWLTTFEARRPTQHPL